MLTCLNPPWTHRCKSTWSGSSDDADFLFGSDVERHAVENVRKIDAVAQPEVDELDSSGVRPLVRDAERLG